MFPVPALRRKDPLIATATTSFYGKEGITKPTALRILWRRRTYRANPVTTLSISRSPHLPVSLQPEDPHKSKRLPTQQGLPLEPGRERRTSTIYLGIAFQNNNEFQKAIEHFENFQKEKANLSSIVDEKIAECHIPTPFRKMS